MSDLRKLTISQFDAGVRRGVESRQSRIPTEFRSSVTRLLKGMMGSTASNAKLDIDMKNQKNKQIKDLADYTSRMQKKRQSLVKLGKNASREQYLDAGLPLLDPKAIKDYIPR